MKNLPTTLGELKKSEYEPRSIQKEMRSNLVDSLQKGESIFEGIIGFKVTGHYW